MVEQFWWYGLMWRAREGPAPPEATGVGSCCALVIWRAVFYNVRLGGWH